MIGFYDWAQPKKAKETATFLFLAAFLFLFLFRPFTVDESELKYSFFFTCFLHSLSPALIVLFFLTVLVDLRKKKTSLSYPLAFYGVVFFIVLFFIIGLASFLFRDLIYTNPGNWSLRYFWEEIRNAYLAGILFTSYFIFAAFYFHSKQNKVSNIVPAEVIESTLPSEIFIQTHVKIDDFRFSPSDFLFARADGNYIELTMRGDGEIKRELKRISLKGFELQLAEHKSLLRCHRAYLLNVQQIDHVSGNSQGYFVSFDGIEDKVPVSRAKLALFNQHYQQQEVIN